MTPINVDGEIYYVKNVMIDVESCLEEGIDILDEQFDYITCVVGASVDDEDIVEIVKLNIDA